MRHPCGALPITSFHLSVYYCHAHMAWFARAATWQQRDDVDVVEVNPSEMEWGPFDDAADVLAWLRSHLERTTELPHVLPGRAS